MINFFRTLFGYGTPSGNRMVVGAPAAVHAKDAVYVRNSIARLNKLQDLCHKYKTTPHAEKLNTVFEKTRRIHAYLLEKKRPHELELFHLQHTDHFINTFSVIIDVHRRHTAPAREAAPVQQKVPVPPVPPPPAPTQQRPPVKQVNSRGGIDVKVDDVLRKIETETLRGIQTAHKVTEMVRRVAGQAPSMSPTQTMQQSRPALTVPVINIDTFTRIHYPKEKGSTGPVAGEVGYTSTDDEKEDFLSHVASRLGIDQSLLTYVGNTVLAIPGGPVAYMPVICWKDCTYALTMHDYRLFPVKLYRQNR